ncbi:Protein of unknown function DUF374 [hydrothermal vent metagenome]|uniref:DUF374 domain-containing protein n=1 Tax=hydrothermal vent metagenome TaxID=652676 RepID=A0A1W1BRF5_9ZZZZ
MRDTGLSIVAFIIYAIMRLIWYSAKREYHYLTPIEERQHIIACWHSDLLMIPVYRVIRPNRSASAIISQHKDGEIVAKVLSYLSIKAMRGSTRKGAKRVLLEAMRAIESGEEIQISPDGPKGPRYHIHDGVIALAMKGKLPIMTIGYRADRYWQLNSWDKFVIPKPFAKIDFYIESISIDGLDIDSAKSLLRTKMLEHSLP